jgi:hypothetical protein
VEHDRSGTGLFSFRFVLLATAFVIPQSLSFRGLDAAQFGPAVLWTAVPEMFLAVFAAHLLNKGLDSRLLMALGFATIGTVCLVNAQFTSAWAAENYFRTELLMAVGQSFAFVGLVSSLILQAFFSGGLDSPYRVLTFSAFLHGVRIFGGQLGTTLMARFIAEQEKVHSYLVGLHVQPGAWIADHTVNSCPPDWRPDRAGPRTPPAARSDSSPASVRQQAYSLTFIDAFHLIAWVSVATLILIATLRRFPLNFRDLAALDAGARPARTSDSHDSSSFDLRTALVRERVRGIRPTTRDAGARRHHASRSRRPGAGAQPCGPPRAVVGRREGPREGRGEKRLLSPGAKRHDLVHLTDTQLVEFPPAGSASSVPLRFRRRR